MAATFTCSLVRSLPGAPDGWHAVSYAPLADGSLGCLQSTADINAVIERNRGRRDTGLPFEPFLSPGDRGRLVSGDRPDDAAEFPLEYPVPRFDRLSDGGWVLVHTRCNDGDLNAFFLSRRGDVRLRFAVGDGVEQAQADDVGGVWVSHFDEGVSGVHLGSAGLAHFDASGVETWRANTDDLPALPAIDDCYALNAFGSEAWAYYYSDFPILRVPRDGVVRLWSNGVLGANAIAVKDNNVVLFGGWTARAPSRIALLNLRDGSAVPVGQLTLSDHDRRDDFAVGRGDTIHVVGRGSWRRFSVEEIVTAVAAAGDAAAPEPDPLDHVGPEVQFAFKTGSATAPSDEDAG